MPIATGILGNVTNYEGMTVEANSLVQLCPLPLLDPATRDMRTAELEKLGFYGGEMIMR